MELQWTFVGTPEYDAAWTNTTDESYSPYNPFALANWSLSDVQTARQLGYDGPDTAPQLGDADPQIPQEFRDWVQAGGWQPGIAPTVGGSYRGFGQSGKVNPASVTFNSNNAWQDDLMFSLASMFLNPMGGVAAGGAAGGVGADLFANQAAAQAFNTGMTGAMSVAGQGASDKDILRSGVTGALSSYTPDVAQYAGISNPNLKSAVNTGLQRGATSAVGGGDWKTAAAQGALPGLASYFTGDMGNMFDSKPTQTSQNYDFINPPAGTWQGPGMPVYSPTTTQNYDYINPQSDGTFPNAGPGMPGGANMGYGTLSRPTESASSWSSTPVGQYVSQLFSNPQRLGDMAAGLAGLYTGYRNRRQAKELMRGMGGRRGSYEQQLRQQLMRQDAARGRRSDYGGREVELQARLAQLDAQQMPAMAQLSQLQSSGLADMFRSGLRLAGASGIFGQGLGSQPTQQPTPRLQAPQVNTTPLNTDYGLDYNLFRRQLGGGG